MPVAFSSSGSATAGLAASPTNTVSGTVTVAAVRNRILVVALGWETASGIPARSITSLTLNGDPLELLSTASYATGSAGNLTASSALAYFLAPASGTATLVCTLDGTADHIIMLWATLADCKLQAPEVTASSSTVIVGPPDAMEVGITPLTSGGMLATSFAPNTETATHTASGGMSTVVGAVRTDGGAGQRVSMGQIAAAAASLQSPRYTLSSGNISRGAMVAAVWAAAYPSKVGEPYISGTQQEGMTLTCHPGRYQYADTLSPAATYAYVWRKNGAANGTTTQTYVPVAGDVGASIDCVVTPSNGAGAGATATTAAVTPIATAANRIAVTDFAAGRVFQREGTSCTIQVSGTFVGATPNDVQARVLNRTTGATVLDWTTLGAPTIGAGTFTGTLANVPQGGWYYIEVRGRDAGPSVLATGQGGNPWGVGKLFPKAGSSTFERYGSEPTSEVPSDLISQFNVGGSTAWGLATGAGDIAFLNAMLAMEPTIPVATLCYANGGTRLKKDATAGWMYTTDTDGNYPAFCAGVNSVKARSALTYCGVEALLLHVGSGDAQNNTIVSQAAHISNYGTMLSNTRASSGSGTSLGQSTLKVFIGGGQRKPSPTSPDIQFTWERSSELEICVGGASAIANTYYIPGMTDLEVSHDLVHYRALQFAEHGRRAARAVGNVFGLTSLPYQGPKPASATYEAATGFLTITYTIPSGASLTTEDNVTTGLTGYRVGTALDVNGDITSLQTITDARIISSNQVRLTVNTGLSAPVYWDAYAGANPSVGRRVFDSSGNPP